MHLLNSSGRGPRGSWGGVWLWYWGLCGQGHPRGGFQASAGHCLQQAQGSLVDLAQCTCHWVRFPRGDPHPLMGKWSQKLGRLSAFTRLGPCSHGRGRGPGRAGREPSPAGRAWGPAGRGGQRRQLLGLPTSTCSGAHPPSLTETHQGQGTQPLLPPMVPGSPCSESLPQGCPAHCQTQPTS